MSCDDAFALALIVLRSVCKFALVVPLLIGVSVDTVCVDGVVTDIGEVVVEDLCEYTYQPTTPIATTMTTTRIPSRAPKPRSSDLVVIISIRFLLVNVYAFLCYRNTIATSTKK
jgi:hypothetical protein